VYKEGFMAIYGIGFKFGKDDVSGDFFSGNLVGTGWGVDDAPDIHQFFNFLKVGDIVYLKSAGPGTKIAVRAVGIITNDDILDEASSSVVQIGRSVRWISKRQFDIPKPADEKNNVRSNTIYEEYHPEVQAQILGEFPIAP
jgi:hypothetical protein